MLTAEVAKGPDVSGVQFEGLPVPLLRRSVIPLPPQLSSQEVEKGRRRRRRRRMRMRMMRRRRRRRMRMRMRTMMMMMMIGTHFVK